MSRRRSAATSRKIFGSNKSTIRIVPSRCIAHAPQVGRMLAVSAQSFRGGLVPVMALPERLRVVTPAVALLDVARGRVVLRAEVGRLPVRAHVLLARRLQHLERAKRRRVRV